MAFTNSSTAAVATAVTALRGPSAVGDGRGPRLAPHNLELEAALLGAVLRNNRAYDPVADFLEPAHFYAAQHQRIFEIIQRQLARGQVADPATLGRFMEDNEALAQEGEGEGAGTGAQYLYDLAANVVTVVNVRDYGREIRDLYLKRELIGIGEEVVNTAYDSREVEDTAERQIERAESHLYTLAESGAADRTAISLGKAVGLAVGIAEKAFKRSSKLVGISTGFREIDAMLGGLHPSDLVILASRPAMGKTSLATNIAYNAAAMYRSFTDDAGNEIEEGGKVLFFSLEMSAEQLAARIISERAQVSSDKIRRGDISEAEFRRIAKSAEQLSGAPLFIDDAPALTIAQLRQRARRVKRQHRLHMIIVDYLQLLQASGHSRPENRVQEVSEITRGLKQLAREMNAPVLALSQLSRQVEQREDKRPHLADLRESGSIEQDADVVSFIYRPEYYLEREKPELRSNESDRQFEERVERYNDVLRKARNVAEVIIAKQRHGPTGTVELYFAADYTRFSDLDRQHENPYGP